VPATDLRDKFDQSSTRATTVVTLTKDGPDLLESRRQDGDAVDRQAFHHGVHKPRELTHDAQVYRAYLKEAERLREEGAHIHRVLLDDELKREYQQFLLPLHQCAVGPLPHCAPQRGIDALESGRGAVRPMQLLNRRDIALSVSPSSGGVLCRPCCA
jgi:hypothetical protein